MNLTPWIRRASGVAAFAALLIPLQAQATEGGTSLYPNGVEGFMTGALPPPGVYGMVYGNHYSADHVNDNNGNNLNIPGFNVAVNVITGRLAWVTGTKVMGGDLVGHVIVPMINLDVSVPGASQSKSGIGDITTGLGVGYHHSPNLHSIVGVDFILPTGGYTKGDIANIGKNHWGFEPVYALSYVDPKGFNGDIKFGYMFNGHNDATGYTSGQEFHFDYAAGWGLGNGWTVGVGGYVYMQVTDDTQAGVTVANNKGRAMSMGPNIKYDSGKGWFATVKWEKEFDVVNRPQGDALWFKVVAPL